MSAAAAAQAGLRPEEVVVVTNAESKDSAALGRLYAERRGIPADHVIAVRTTGEFAVSREDYEAQIRAPLAEALAERKLDRKVRCLALMRGVPVRVGGAKDAEKLTDATVDSELALLWWPQYPLEKWVDNPLLWRRPEGPTAPLADGRPGPRRTVLMTARIDGPTDAAAGRIVRDCLAVEAEGLKGAFYIDAGGRLPQYDRHLRDLHAFLTRHTRLKAVLDEKAALFARGACPDAAMYVGWGAGGDYVPAFLWRKGAVGWHIGGFEARGLRDGDSPRWCGRMVQDGVAATLGAVEDPYLGMFPRPEEFFPLLLTGKYTVAECYWRTVPGASWRMTLIADPLYNPFAADPQVRPDELPKGLAPPD